MVFNDTFVQDVALVKVAVVIPAFQAANSIGDVILGIPTWVRVIVVVDDGSSDGTATLVAAAAVSDERIRLLRHTSNLGVAASMVSGIRQTLDLDIEIIVKMDSDGQMSPIDLPAMLSPLIYGHADCAKGNRFRDFQALRQMPAVRRVGNLLLSFLCKAAVGYWNLFDPTNGFVATTRPRVSNRSSTART